MAESLRRLVNIGTFNVLGEKLERWLDNYYINTCDQNVARSCEIIELNAKVQGQLFKLLSVCAGEGGLYGGTSAIKNRLLPFLGQSFFTSGTTTDTSLSVIADATMKNRELDDVQDMYEQSMQELESDIRTKEMENQDLRDELNETKDRIITKERTSTTDKLFLDNENRDLRRKLAAAEDEIRNLRAKAGLFSDYDTQVRRLRDDIALLTGRRDALLRSSTSVKDDIASYKSPAPSKLKSDEPLALGLADAQDELVKLRARASLVDDLERQVRNLRDEHYVSSSKKSYLDGDTYDSLSTYRYTPRVGSPLSIDDPVQRVRQGNLVARWNDAFSQDRLDAMDTLRRYSDDYENNQRIIFSAIQESFHAAKMAFSQFKMKVRANLLSSHYGPETLEEAVQDYVNRNSDLYDLPGMVSEAFSVAKLAFRQFKMKVRANLAITHVGPETLEEGVQDYVNRNSDLCDLPGMVSDVIRALNRNPRIFLPPDSTFAVIQPFIREAVKLAWQMSALAHPLDMSVATDAELYDSTKYRRSYDSEYTAPLVNHHIWPSLMQGPRCLMKGECVTRRGASLSSARRSRSPTRAMSPGPRSRSRSRSCSPTRRSRSSSPKRY